ncbi:hypothetical protein [Echinicola pacifica]|nr:hypothetical protein [Echinicola pacifica]
MKKFQLLTFCSMVFWASCESNIPDIHIHTIEYKDSIEVTPLFDQLNQIYSPFFDYFNRKYFYTDKGFYLGILGIGKVYMLAQYDSALETYKNEIKEVRTGDRFVYVGNTHDIGIRGETIFSTYTNKNMYIKKHLSASNKKELILSFSGGANVSNFLVTDQNAIVMSDINPTDPYNLVFYINDTSLRKPFKRLFVSPGKLLTDRFFEFDVYNNVIYYCKGENVLYKYDLKKSTYDSIVFDLPKLFKERIKMPVHEFEMTQLSFEKIWKYKNDLTRGIEVTHDAIYLEHIIFDRDVVKSSKTFIHKLDHKGSTIGLVASESFLHFDKKGNYFSSIERDSSIILKINPVSDLFE